jgi:hypothetical protein
VATRSFLQIEAGSRWVFDRAQGAHVDATGADRVLLPGVARLMLASGRARAQADDEVDQVLAGANQYNQMWWPAFGAA